MLTENSSIYELSIEKILGMLYNRSIMQKNAENQQGGWKMASIRNFILSFLLAVILFSVIAYFGVNFMVDILNQPAEKTDDTADQDDLNALTSDASGILNLLLIVTDEYQYTPDANFGVNPEYDNLIDQDRRQFEKEIEFMTLVSYNSYLKQVVVTAFPAEMTVPANDAELDLNSAYYFADKGLYGLDKDYFTHAISATVGVQIEYTATVDIDDYVKVADNLGGLTVDSPEHDVDLSVAEGETTLSSEQLLAMLTEHEYEEPAARTQFISNVTVAVLNRICSTAYYVDAFNEFDRISTMLQNTEFDEAALTQWRSLIFSYKFYKLHQLTPIGAYEAVDGETVFIIDRAGTISYFKQYMQDDKNK